MGTAQCTDGIRIHAARPSASSREAIDLVKTWPSSFVTRFHFNHEGELFVRRVVPTASPSRPHCVPTTFRFCSTLCKNLFTCRKAKAPTIAVSSVSGAFRAVRKGGLEPPHPTGYEILNLARLPIPPLSQNGAFVVKHKTYSTTINAVRHKPMPSGGAGSKGSVRIALRTKRLQSFLYTRIGAVLLSYRHGRAHDRPACPVHS